MTSLLMFTQFDYIGVRTTFIAAHCSCDRRRKPIFGKHCQAVAFDDFYVAKRDGRKRQERRRTEESGCGTV
jgi:hypothetical protein